MPKVKKSKRKTEILPCVYDRRLYEIYVQHNLVASSTSPTDAKKEATRLRRLRKPLLCPEQVNIKLISTCTYGPEVCKYWKSCYESKGTTFTESWGKKKVMLLEIERQQQKESKKNKELDRFF